METIYNGFSKNGGTYKITNRINGKVYYGSAKCFQKRQYQHLKLLKQNKHGNKHLQNAFNQYGLEAFVFEVIEIIEGSKQDRLNAEQKLLDLHWDNCNNCYNTRKEAISSEGNKSKNPEETKLKQSIASKKMWGNPNYKNYMSTKFSGEGNPFFGKRHTQKFKEKRSKDYQGKFTGKNNGMYGKYGNLNKTSKIYNIKLLSPTGEIFGPICGLDNFCRINNLSSSHVRSLLAGKRKSHKGWTLV